MFWFWVTAATPLACIGRHLSGILGQKSPASQGRRRKRIDQAGPGARHIIGFLAEKMSL
jgi:hypothetical protein